MEILFIRHGESTANRAYENKEEYDKENIVLTDKGVAQAKATGKYIKKVFGKIDCIIHSPIYRCQQTAEFIAKNIEFKKELLSNELLLEVGEKSLFDKMTFKQSTSEMQKIDKEYNGKVKQELNPFIRSKKDMEFSKKMMKKYKHDPSFDDINTNYNAFLNQIKKLKNSCKRILVVGHYGTSMGMVNIITGVDIYNDIVFNSKIIATNCSITSVLYNDNNKFELIQCPNNNHLIKINEQYK